MQLNATRREARDAAIVAEHVASVAILADEEATVLRHDRETLTRAAQAMQDAVAYKLQARKSCEEAKKLGKETAEARVGTTVAQREVERAQKQVGRLALVLTWLVLA
jgi:hypothetical protein